MRLGLAHLSDACTEIVSTHYTLRRRLTNADAEASLQQHTHATAPDHKEKNCFELRQFFNKIAVPALFRRYFPECVERASGSVHDPTDPNDFKAFLVSSNCHCNSFFELVPAAFNCDFQQRFLAGQARSGVLELFEKRFSFC